MLKKPVTIALSGLMLLILAGYAFYTFGQKSIKPKASPTITVDVVQVQKAVLPAQITAVGTLVAKDRAKLSAELAGTIAKFYASEGQHVQPGQPIIQLDDSIYHTQLQAIQADLARNEQRYLRIKKLASSGGESKQELDNAQAELQLKQAELSVKRAQLEKMLIKAPFEGILAERMVSVGEYVNSGEDLIEIISKQNLKVKYVVPESYLPRLKLGQTISVSSGSYPNQTYPGKLDFIAPLVDENSGTLSLEASLPNPDERLSPGMFVRVKHNLADRQSVLLIPQACLIPTIEGYSVYRIIEGQAKLIPITATNRWQNWVEVEKGLECGEQVVLAGQQKLKDGSPVKSLLKEDKFEAE